MVTQKREKKNQTIVLSFRNLSRWFTAAIVAHKHDISDCERLDSKAVTR